MTDRSDSAAVLITGVYGTGKSTLVEAIAGELEERGVRYGAIDLDWLGWFDPGVPDDIHGAGNPVLRKTLDAVVANYHDTGVRRFVLGGLVLEPDELAATAATLGMPMTVVRLTLPIDEIERRLSTAVTSQRAEDLAYARADAAAGRGDGVGDLVLVNDRPTAETAREVLAFLGW